MRRLKESNQPKEEENDNNNDNITLDLSIKGLTGITGEQSAASAIPVKQIQPVNDYEVVMWKLRLTERNVDEMTKDILQSVEVRVLMY